MCTDCKKNDNPTNQILPYVYKVEDFGKYGSATTQPQTQPLARTMGFSWGNLAEDLQNVANIGVNVVAGAAGAGINLVNNVGTGAGAVLGGAGGLLGGIGQAQASQQTAAAGKAETDRILALMEAQKAAANKNLTYGIAIGGFFLVFGIIAFVYITRNK